MKNKHWDKMYDDIYNINPVGVNNSSALDYKEDLRNYFVMDGDSIFMLYNDVLNSLYEKEIKEHKEDNNLNYYDFKRTICSSPQFLPEIKDKWCFYSAVADRSVIEYFDSHNIEDCIAHYCYIEGHDTLLIENDLTIVYCFDIHSYNCFFNYGEVGNTKVTKIVNKKLLPRVPISDALIYTSSF